MAATDFSYACQLKLADKPCLLVGGGLVALRKAKKLLAAKALITIIAPSLQQELVLWHQAKKIIWHQRCFAPGDTKDYFLVIAATNNAAVNAAVAREALAEKALVNVTDNPALGNFSVPSSLQKGALTFTIATGGMPALTKALKEDLSAYYNEAFLEFTAFLLEQRPQVKNLLPTAQKRQAFWQALLNPELLALVHKGKADLAKERILHAIAGLRTQS